MTSRETATVKLTDLIAPSFYDLHYDIKEGRHTHYKLNGGRGSAKSSFISIEIIMGMMEDHEANAVCYRKVGNTLQESVYEQLLWAIDALNVNHLWKANLTPLRLTYLPTGQRIIFRGMDDPNKAKSIKVRKGYFKYIWLEERAELDGEEDERKVLQSLMRGGNKFVVFYSWNPPYLKKTKPKAYEHEYLGIATGTGGQVFDNVVIRKITAEELARFDQLRNGLDWGYAADPFAFIQSHYDKTHRRLFIFGEICQVKLSNRKAALKMIRVNPDNRLTIADSAEPKSIAELQETGINIKGAVKGPGSVEFGIKFLQDLEEIIIDPERCPNAAREFSGYELERDKNGNFKGKYPDKDNHTIDAARYALEDDMPRKGYTKI